MIQHFVEVVLAFIAYCVALLARALAFISIIASTVLVLHRHSNKRKGR
jgi:hypothetical protein